jgi:ACS family glucarate transporter-like MFS transporter
MAEAVRPDHGAKRTRVRHMIIFLLFIVTVINYADRATFSIAGSSAADEFGLTSVETGWILSAFAWSYVLAQIPGGALLDRFGTKSIYVGALVLWSLFTFLQGFVGVVVGTVSAAVAFFIMRFMVGLAEAPSFPANARIVAAWFPSSERGTASAIFNSAQYFALVAFAPIMGWLVHSYGWRSVFYFMGLVGLIAAAVFAAFIHPPTRHKRINQAELDYIEAGGALVNMEEVTAQRGTAFTWHNVRQILTSRMLLGVYLGQYCINALTYFFVTWFPIYLVRERGMTIVEAGLTAAPAAMCGFIGGLLGGIVSDYILKKSGNVTRARKLPLLIGMLLSTAIVACNYVEGQFMIIVIMSVAFFGKGIASLGWAVVSDTSPKELAGVTGGIFNTFGNTAGIVTPIVIGYLVQSSGSFDSALWFLAAHCIVTILAYFLIVGKIERLVLKPRAGAA